MTSYDITLEWPNAKNQTVAVDARETVLEAAQREGIRLPYDCRKGTCTACVGRVLEVEKTAPGDDESSAESVGDDDAVDIVSAFDYHGLPEGLTERERADGYVLLCIAAPRADCRVEVGPMVRAGIGDSPWG